MPVKKIKKIKKITAQEFGADWPFSVSSGTIVKTTTPNCGIMAALIFNCRRGKFALNGIASNIGIKSIHPIWLNNPEVPEIKKSLQPILDFAAEM